MENHGSDCSKPCVVCGAIPSAECDTPGCQSDPSAEASAGGVSTSGEAPPHLLSHEELPYTCVVCGDEVLPGVGCGRIDCPRVAVQQIQTAALDTPFKLGL